MNCTAQYAAPLYPLENSSYLVQTGSNNATHIYPITLSNVPSGNGTYQQLLTISNPSQYGINSAGSNIQFVAGNGTLLYAWIQSINSTAMQVWVKNFKGSSTIDMQVLPSFENLFSLNGNLGISTIPSENNVQKVFPNSWNFVENQTVSGLNTSAIGYSFSSSGLTISQSSYGDGVALITNASYSNQSIAISGFTVSGNTGGLTWSSSPLVSSTYKTSSQTELYVTGGSALRAYVSGSEYNINYPNLLPNVNAYATYMESVSGKSVQAFFNSSYEMQNTTNIFTSMHYGVIEWYDRSSVISYLAIGNVPLQSMPTYTIGAGVPAYTYQWYNNGTAVSGATSSTYTPTFSSPGTFPVYVVVSDYYENVSSNIINETVNPDPSVKITAPQNPAYVGIAITITGNITGGTGPYNESWYINNIKVSTNSSLVFNESSPGSYNISLIIEDSRGMIADSNVIDENVDKPYITVTYSHPPIASQSVTIYAHVLNNSANYSLYWTFSGGTATGHNVTYAFSTAGYREFTIKMTNSAGYSETQTFTVFVSLYITISASPKTGNAPLKVDFEAEALGGSSFIYSWNFGNGNISDAQDTSNIFSAGNYTVTLTVTDSAGVTGNASVYIQAWPAPVSFIYSNDENITYDFHFKAVPNWDAKGPYNATWNMPNGQVLYGLNVSYYFPVYSKTNDITVVFRFSNTSIYQGDSYSQTIVVTMKPANISVKFSYPDPIPVNTVLDLNVSVSAPDTNSFTINWNVSGSHGTGRSFTYDFSNVGTFYINITVRDNLGASTHISRIITVEKISSSSNIIIKYTKSTDANIISYNISVHSKYPIQSVQAYLEGALLTMNLTFSGGNATAGYVQYYTLSMNQRDFSAGEYQINVDAFTSNSQSNSTIIPFTVSSQYSKSPPFNIVKFFGGIDNTIYILLTIGGIIVTLVFTRPKPTDIDIDGTVLQAEPGKPVKELKKRK